MLRHQPYVGVMDDDNQHRTAVLYNVAATSNLPVNTAMGLDGMDVIGIFREWTGPSMY